MKWFNSYLQNRKQFVSLNGIDSSFSDITTGVPQGSILGPLLFLIYVNDLPNCTSSKLLMYADDTCLIQPITINTKNDHVDYESQRLLNKNLQNLDWLTVNKLSLNISKTKFIMFHYAQKLIKPQHIPVLKINEVEINNVTYTKFLGITFDQHLKFNLHIQHVANKISKTNGVLSLLKHYVPQTILKTIYNALILPFITYGVAIWGFGNCDRIVKIQKKSIRNITNSFFLAHCQPLCKANKILLFEDLFNIACLKIYFLYKNKKLPNYFHENNFINIDRSDRSRRIINKPNKFDNFLVSHSLPNVILPMNYTNKSLTRKCLRMFLPTLINSLYISTHILDKVNTHSLNNVVFSCKEFVFSKYNEVCNIPFCYICNLN